MRMLSLGELIEFFESIDSPYLDDSEMPIWDLWDLWDLNEPKIIDDFEEAVQQLADEPECLGDPEIDYDFEDTVPPEYLPEMYSEYKEKDDVQFPIEEEDEKEILELLNLLEHERPDEKEILELLDAELTRSAP